MTTTEDVPLSLPQQVNAKKKNGLNELGRPTQFTTKPTDNRAQAQQWMDGLLQATSSMTTTGHGSTSLTTMDPAINAQKLALHRRGMSLDETRVSTGLVGVGANSIHDSAIATTASNPTTNSQYHRRVLSHSSNSNYYPPHKQQTSQPLYQYPYASGPLPPLSQSVNAIAFGNGSSATAVSNTSSKSLLPEVKFVNSTVEALEDQIRKEDAPKKKHKHKKHTAPQTAAGAKPG